MVKLIDKIIDTAIKIPIIVPWLFIISQLPKIITIELIAPLEPPINPGFQNTGVEIVLHLLHVMVLVLLMTKALKKETLLLQLGHENFGILKIRKSAA